MENVVWRLSCQAQITSRPCLLQAYFIIGQDLLSLVDSLIMAICILTLELTWQVRIPDRGARHQASSSPISQIVWGGEHQSHPHICKWPSHLSSIQIKFLRQPQLSPGNLKKMLPHNSDTLCRWLGFLGKWEWVRWWGYLSLDLCGETQVGCMSGMFPLSWPTPPLSQTAAAVSAPNLNVFYKLSTSWYHST